MPRSDRSVDRSSAAAFIAFAIAAAVWIGVMATQPKSQGLQASVQAPVIVMAKDIALVQPQPHWIELAGIAR